MIGAFIQVNLDSIRAKLQPVGYVVTESGCWEWVGIKRRDGYGGAHRPGTWRCVLAHRLVYEQQVGPIPDGMELDHLCRNKMCVRPDHLEAVPPIVNNHRSRSPSALNVRKTHCPKGHPYSGDNLRIGYRRDGSRGDRLCRTCQNSAKRERSREYRLRIKQLTEKEDGNG